MKKQLLIIGITVIFIVIGLSGCTGEPKKIQYYGDDETLTVHYPDKIIKLEVYGNNCTYTVTKETNLVEVVIYGENSSIMVSRSHSFETDIVSNNSTIDYYD